jgi:hypothetical protein
LPTRPNATIRSPVAASMEHGRQAANTAYQAHNALIFRLFCSLRLSVRTPPFHGGESGSIPLGSASYFNDLLTDLPAVSNVCPISAHGLRWTNPESCRCRLEAQNLLEDFLRVVPTAADVCRLFDTPISRVLAYRIVTPSSQAGRRSVHSVRGSHPRQRGHQRQRHLDMRQRGVASKLGARPFAAAGRTVILGGGCSTASMAA